jgi:hypothetical protein
MKNYYIIVKNSSGDNLGVFETFEEAVKFMESRSACLITTFSIQVIPKRSM